MFSFVASSFPLRTKKKQTARVCVFVLRAHVTERKNTTRRQLFLLLKAKKKSKSQPRLKKKKKRESATGKKDQEKIRVCLHLRVQSFFCAFLVSSPACVCLFVSRRDNHAHTTEREKTRENFFSGLVFLQFHFF
jgi:hypothetical protein